jgi:hypothetical protein
MQLLGANVPKGSSVDFIGEFRNSLNRLIFNIYAGVSEAIESGRWHFDSCGRNFDSCSENLRQTASLWFYEVRGMGRQARLTVSESLDADATVDLCGHRQCALKLRLQLGSSLRRAILPLARLTPSRIIRVEQR